MRLQVTDLAGRLLLENELAIGGTQQLVDAGRLAEGLYFLQVVSEVGVLAIEKFVKQ